ncbi:MAG: hypothetical protein C7B43_20095 [Sulfobacillus benefaciens]|uniref:Uncharacterized protein n=1 Tax=Sulfobacillus benefaciens TaxID=453960 RepID=A0A2T2WMG1_9FIRM|nr:MAG: hypothetical protein C7B43_20095 [Sulfobacillus benefaciens]HBQ94747.1 hypothetical protein [Sulfobacillus sp.]
MFLLQLIMIAQGLCAVNRLLRLHFRGDWPYRWQSPSQEGRVWLQKWQAVYRTVYAFYCMMLVQSVSWLILLKYLRAASLSLWLLTTLGIFVVIFAGLSRHLQGLVRDIFDKLPTPLPSFSIVYRFLTHPPAIDR